MNDWVRSSLILAKKDLRIEFRNRIGINGLLMFSLGAIMLLILGMRTVAVSTPMMSSLLWLIIFLSGSVGLFHSFAAEEDGRTANLLRLTSTPAEVFTSKLLYNFVVVATGTVLTVLCFIIFMRMHVTTWPSFCVALLLGTLGMAATATLLGAIVARADASAIVLPVLLFPLLLPLLWMATDLTMASLEPGSSRGTLSGSITGLIAYSGLVLTAGSLLMDKIWLD